MPSSHNSSFIKPLIKSRKAQWRQRTILCRLFSAACFCWYVPVEGEDVAMEVTFALTPQDLWEFNSFVIRRILAFKIRFAVRFAIVPLCIIALTAVAGFQSWQCVLFGFAAAVVWVPFCLWSARFRISRIARKSLGLLETQTLKVDGEGVRQATAQVDSLIQWTSFPEVGESASQILFFMDKQHALIIPKRVFSSLAQGEAFLDKARRCWNAAKNGQPAPDDVADDDASTWPPAPRLGA